MKPSEEVLAKGRLREAVVNGERKKRIRSRARCRSEDKRRG